MTSNPVVVIGAGMAGLAASLRLLAADTEVIVIEPAEYEGGKMRQVTSAAGPIDSGPTVFTMYSVFDELLNGVGSSLSEVVTARPLSLLARHAWEEGPGLDLFADRQQSADAIADFAGLEEALGYLKFCAEAGRIFNLLEPTMLRATKPNPLSLGWRARGAGLSGLLGLRPFTTFWRALDDHFKDPRLKQLFGRYATYCGSNPWRAPATLMLIAHLEQEGVWQLEGGMQSLASGLAAVARQRGATFINGESVEHIDSFGGRLRAVRTSTGREIRCSDVICTADLGALRGGLLGDAARRAIPARPSERSLSAMTLSTAAHVSGLELAYHTVFFSKDYKREFDTLFTERALPEDPTVYVCAQDRSQSSQQKVAESSTAGERIFALANAPAIGDSHTFSDEEVAECQQRMLNKISRCGVEIQPLGAKVLRSPSDFEARFPGSGGAIYGQATHGWLSAFQRPGSRSRLRGLYLAGGGVHPGAGVPMVTLSGMQAADSVLADRDSTSRSRTAGTAGGT